MIPISHLLTMIKHPFIIVSLIESKKCAAFHEVPLIALLFILVIGHAMMKGAWPVQQPDKQLGFTKSQGQLQRCHAVMHFAPCTFLPRANLLPWGFASNLRGFDFDQLRSQSES